MRIAKSALVLIFIVAFSSAARSQTNGNVAYFCTAEAAGGLAYSKTEKKWVGVGFHARHSFILRMKFLLETHLKDETRSSYQVTITEFGKNVGSKCKSRSGDEEVDVGTRVQAVLCNMDSSEGYRINLKNNRYLRVFPFGYYTVGAGKFVGEVGDMKIIPDTDEDSDTPFVEGGTCTKID